MKRDVLERCDADGGGSRRYAGLVQTGDGGGTDDGENSDDGGSRGLGDEGYLRPKLTQRVVLPEANVCIIAVVEKVNPLDIATMESIEDKAEEEMRCREKTRLLAAVRQRQKLRRAAQVSRRMEERTRRRSIPPSSSTSTAATIS